MKKSYREHKIGIRIVLLVEYILTPPKKQYSLLISFACFIFDVVSFPSTGRSDPQISVTTQEGNPLPRRCSNPPSHSSSPQTQAKHGATSANTESQGQGAKPPRSPLGQGGLLRGQKHTWEGQPGSSSGSQSSITSASSQSHIGPVR